MCWCTAQVTRRRTCRRATCRCRCRSVAAHQAGGALFQRTWRLHTQPPAGAAAGPCRRACRPVRSGLSWGCLLSSLCSPVAWLHRCESAAGGVFALLAYPCVDKSSPICSTVLSCLRGFRRYAAWNYMNIIAWGPMWVAMLSWIIHLHVGRCRVKAAKEAATATAGDGVGNPGHPGGGAGQAAGVAVLCACGRTWRQPCG